MRPNNQSGDTMKVQRLNGASALVVLICLAAAPAHAQSGKDMQVDPSARATFGEVALYAGFPNDPYGIMVTAGGTIEASRVASGCSGRVARAPDFQLTYSAGGAPLTFGTIANTDTTLLINGPDGRWTCDDDSGGDGDALVTYQRPMSGVYDVWVGVFSGDNDQAELFITELNDRRSDRDFRRAYDEPANSYGASPDPSQRPTYGDMSLSSFFTPDPRRVQLTAGGGFDASELGGGCVGMIASAPDFQLNYRAGIGLLSLTVGVNSDSDTTLVIRAPDGRWYCDDDGATRGFNPLVRFSSPRSGDYDIWVGNRGSASAPAELYFSESGEH